MKIIVTGATGFVGVNLVACLEKNGHQVMAIVREKKADFTAFSPNVVVCEIPMERYHIYRPVKEQYDIFIHLAWAGTSGESRADYDMQIKNIQYSCDAVKLAHRFGCKRFIYAGSIMEYDAESLLHSNEGICPPKTYIYNTAKLSAGLMAKSLAYEYGMEYCSYIISNVFGPGEHSERFINSMVRRMIANEIIQLTHGRQKYDFIYIDDAVNAMMIVALSGINQYSYYIGNETVETLKTYVERMKKVIGSNSELEYGRIPLLMKTLDYSEFDTSRMKKEFGWSPQVNFETGIQKLVEFEKGEKNAI